jgi:hypothetical protein
MSDYIEPELDNSEVTLLRADLTSAHQLLEQRGGQLSEAISQRDRLMRDRILIMENLGKVRDYLIAARICLSDDTAQYDGINFIKQAEQILWTFPLPAPSMDS